MAHGVGTVWNIFLVFSRLLVSGSLACGLDELLDDGMNGSNTRLNNYRCFRQKSPLMLAHRGGLAVGQRSLFFSFCFLRGARGNIVRLSTSTFSMMDDRRAHPSLYVSHFSFLDSV
ncbi:hypothetical protein B0T26DRAFT_714327 [Lasiosphaeria miniovina]|uniref:Secreted protein n=1 Tax=Lasiosphaeria miniovina TaxID=1954250 RepID=A0AA40AAS5_9PEZI|nr:uncharacterized protein B0T26DRAFT_714327 [Lasiosphaeria miniovina]KAK0712439.1 hypothetical protein B0T26DRAFT_714327 [Lasiosphaeria miniovina]